MTRRLASLLAAAIITFGTTAAAATIPYTPQPGPSQQQSRYTTGAQPAAAAAPLPAPGEFTPLPVGGSPHTAFPATVVLPDGTVRLMWREATGHLERDGRIMTTVGNPATGMWAPATEILLDTSAASRDMRPGALSLVDGTLWMTYFYWENGTYSGAMIVPSQDLGVTWGASVRVDGGRPIAVVSSPLVKWGNKLVVTWYGRNAGDPVDTVWISTSLDNGVTWTANRLINAIGANKHTQEPWPIVNGQKLIVLYRDGTWANIAMRVSPDGGATWQNPVAIITQATGNPAAVWATNGNIYLVYRHTVTRDAMLAISKDAAATWQVHGTVLRAPANLGSGSLGMTYAAPTDMGDGMVWCPIGLERSLDISTLYQGWL
jgi:hypothetical protein